MVMEQEVTSVTEGGALFKDDSIISSEGIEITGGIQSSLTFLEETKQEQTLENKHL